MQNKKQYSKRKNEQNQNRISTQNSEIQLIKKISSISERAEKNRSPIFPSVSKFYKV